MDDDIEDAVTARLERAEGVIEGEGGGGDGAAVGRGMGGDVGRAQCGGHNCRISVLLIMEEWSSNTKGLPRLLA